MQFQAAENVRDQNHGLGSNHWPRDSETGCGITHLTHKLWRTNLIILEHLKDSHPRVFQVLKILG